MNNVLSAHQLSLRYPGVPRTTLDQLTFSLKQGERVLLLGASGSGKSSLALCLNGIIPHSISADVRGELRVLAMNPFVEQPSQLARHVGIVFQDPESQFCTLTVEDEIAFGLENLRYERAAIDERIENALAQVGLSGQRKRRLESLSGGMKQRVVLAAALAMQPNLLVLDEVTSNLDAAGVAQVATLIRQLAQESIERTFLLIEHRLDALIDLVTTVLVLDQQGKLLVQAPPRQLFAEQGPLLETLGIWQPTSSTLARYLQRAGTPLPGWPLTSAEAIPALQNCPVSWGKTLQWASPGLAERSQPINEPIIECRDVSFAYHMGKKAIDALNLTLHRGEILALVGPNGAGKTTLAQLLVGFLKPQRGAIHFFDEQRRRFSAPQAMQQCGFVFQNPEHQFVTDTVFDEIALAARQQRLPAIKAQVETLLERFNLQEKSACNPFTLSQGQKRRLSVATMLTTQRSLLVLDEPTFGLDAANTQALVEELLRLQSEGQTLVLVTHDMELVWQVAHRVAVLIDGRLQRIAGVEEVFSDEQLLRRAHLVPPERAILTHAVRTFERSAAQSFKGE